MPLGTKVTKRWLFSRLVAAIAATHSYFRSTSGIYNTLASDFCSDCILPIPQGNTPLSVQHKVHMGTLITLLWMGYISAYCGWAIYPPMLVWCIHRTALHGRAIPCHMRILAFLQANNNEIPLIHSPSPAF